ncbi:MAG: aldehyde dehydrogenase (NADP(+)) [Phycisphaerales bacterium]|nr:aldehyde dehydrogenase (NADP(+)) [Phycisphaerales bacterium]
MLLGRSIIAGKVVDEPSPSALARGEVIQFPGFSPAAGKPIRQSYVAATPEEVDVACRMAWEAFHVMSGRGARDRAALLDRIADEIMALGQPLVELVASECGLHHPRIVSERDRTCRTLRLFAETLRLGQWCRPSIDTGDATRQPVPRPDLRRMLRPLGPVAVFGASNFPLAYSTAGGDTASALAAGCPVIVKGHPHHPGTGEVIGHAITKAVEACSFPAGTFSFVHAGGERERPVGEELVDHPCIRAVGFTGSQSGGMALAQRASARRDPIPVFAEMGSVNPVFVLPHALENQAKSIGERLVASTMAANGQMCTCPGLIFAVRSDGAELMIRTMADAMNKSEPQLMLSPRVREHFLERIDATRQVTGVEIRGGSPQGGHSGGEGTPVYASPVLFRTTFDVFRKNETLHEETFGPSTIVVVCRDPQQVVEGASTIKGSLTASIFAGGYDAAVAHQIQSIMEQRAGRLIFNGVPTGVELATSMVHGGPHPATNVPWTTAVGPMSIERWCRPVCYQNAPDSLLPDELKSSNPLEIVREIDGERTTDALERVR